MLILLLVLLVLFGGFGAWGHSNPSVGPWGWSPVGIVVLILAVLYFTGRL